MNKLKHIVILAFIGVLTSCTNVNEDLKKIIPADAAGVVCIDLHSVATKSSVISDNNEFVIPDELKSIVDNNDDSPLCKLLIDLPVMGINIDSKVYAFFTIKTFSSVFVVALDDEEAARKVIERRTGADFKQVEGLDCVYQEDIFYTVSGNTLFVGKVNKPLEVSKVASNVKRMLSRNATSIANDQEITTCLDAENDVNAYLRLDGLKLMLNNSKTYREISRTIPLIDIFTESDVQAYVATLNFNDKNAVLDVAIKVDDNSEYIKLLSSTLNSPSAHFLKVIPETMDYIVSMSVKGNNFVKLPQVVQLIKTFNKIPFLGRLDIESMLNTIDGPVAIGFAHDTNLDEWNTVIAAKSTAPEAIVRQIASFALALGQQPEVYDGEYIYQYDNKMIKIGIKEGILYVKMLNYEQTEGYAYSNEEARAFFTKSSFGVFARSRNGEDGGYFSAGLNNMKSLEGNFVPINTNTNATSELFKVLCGIKPNSVFDNIETTEGYMPNAIDELNPVY